MATGRRGCVWTVPGDFQLQHLCLNRSALCAGFSGPYQSSGIHERNDLHACPRIGKHNTTSCFYYVTAVASNGLESPVFTDMVCKLSRTIECPSGSNTFAWLAMPDDSPWTNAFSLACWLNAADNLYRWDVSRQTYEVWDCMASTGVNFAVHDGEAIGVEVSTTTVVHLFGKFSPTNLFVWTHYTVPLPCLRTVSYSLRIRSALCSRNCIAA